jgi:hypothetical protein
LGYWEKREELGERLWNFDLWEKVGFTVRLFRLGIYIGKGLGVIRKILSDRIV